jgi:cellulose synthase/poly-beta-1,6-N-acetylglucosamine synthase-like glycosyltransferase
MQPARPNHVQRPRIHLAQWSSFRHVLPVGVVGIISWSVWLLRFTLSRVYRPRPDGFVTTTSVVVPAFREDPDILDRCLRSWLAENPEEIIVVPDP